MCVVEVEIVKFLLFVVLLLFGYVGVFMYEGDMLLVEWCVVVFVLDGMLLVELLGWVELCELFDFDVIVVISC